MWGVPWSHNPSGKWRFADSLTPSRSGISLVPISNYTFLLLVWTLQGSIWRSFPLSHGPFWVRKSRITGGIFQVLISSPTRWSSNCFGCCQLAETLRISSTRTRQGSAQVAPRIPTLVRIQKPPNLDEPIIFQQPGHVCIFMNPNHLHAGLVSRLRQIILLFTHLKFSKGILERISQILNHRLAFSRVPVGYLPTLSPAASPNL